MVTAKLLLLELGLRVGTGLGRSKPSKDSPPILGILAFETAKTMSLLISLYKSLCDTQIRTLRYETFRSEGVRYLNSCDEAFLLSLACSERIEDLDRTVIAVSRLGKKCRAMELQRFDRIYDDLKAGSVDMSRLAFSGKEIDRKISKIDKLVSTTSYLCSGLEVLTEMEAAERKLQQWKSYSGHVTVPEPNFDLFQKKLALQRQQVRRMRAGSLWNQPLDKIVSLMARIICNVFARICVVFGPYVSDLPQVVSDGNAIFAVSPQFPPPPLCSASGPLERSVAKDVIITNSGPISQKPRSGIRTFRHQRPKREIGSGFGTGSDKKRIISRKRGPVTNEASPTTVGASGLALRYANVIILAEKLLNSLDLVDDETREDLYLMLPSAVRVSVNAKLKGLWSCEGLDQCIADGWKEALEGILGWLAPMAHDMVTWQMERNYEQQRLDSKRTVLMVQTLYFSDREKTEAAIVEVLVGLSCICWYRNQPLDQ